jgi:hypothetical protein
MRLPAFAGRHAADHLGAVGKRLLGMEGAGLTRHALGDDARVRIDEDAHFDFSGICMTEMRTLGLARSPVVAS